MSVPVRLQLMGCGHKYRSMMSQAQLRRTKLGPGAHDGLEARGRALMGLGWGNGMQRGRESPRLVLQIPALGVPTMAQWK